MANKNTRSLRKMIRAAGRKGQDNVTIARPVFNYHSQDSGKFNNITFPTARPNKEGVISGSERRNMCMRVYVNRGEGNVGTGSMTCHEPITRKNPVINKGHKYKDFNYRPFAA
jgi:hypothetical protein